MKTIFILVNPILLTCTCFSVIGKRRMKITSQWSIPQQKKFLNIYLLGKEYNYILSRFQTRISNHLSSNRNSKLIIIKNRRYQKSYDRKCLKNICYSSNVVQKTKLWYIWTLSRDTIKVLLLYFVLAPCESTLMLFVFLYFPILLSFSRAT